MMRIAGPQELKSGRDQDKATRLEVEELRSISIVSASDRRLHTHLVLVQGSGHNSSVRTEDGGRGVKGGKG